MAKLIFSAHHLTTVGSSPTLVTCEASQVLLVGGQVVFHLTIDSAKKK